MFIQSSIKENSDILFIYEYPSVNDSKGHIADSNAKAYALQRCKKVGVPIYKTSHHCFLDYPLGTTKVDDFYLTAKKDKASSTVVHNGFYFKEELRDSFTKLQDAIDASRPRIIVCMSRLALSYFTNGDSIHAFRGSMLMFQGTPVLVTYGPLDLYKKTEWHMAWERDLYRVRLYLDKQLDWNEPVFAIDYKQSFDKVVNTLTTIRNWTFDKETRLAVDIETRVGSISFIGVAWTKRDALVIPFITWDDKSYWTAEQEFQIVLLLRQILTHENARILGQNFQYDLQYIVKLWGFKPVIHIDTMVEAHVHFTKGLQLTLSYLASLFCSWYKYWKEDGKDFHKSFQRESDWNQYALYNGYDCCYTFEVAEQLELVSSRASYQDAILMQRAMQNIVVKPVLRGLRFDKKKQLQWKSEYEKTIQSYRAWFLYIVPNESVNANGKSDWFDSPTQLATFFYKQLAIDPVLDKKTKRPTTNDAALAEIGRMEPILRPLTDMLQSYRSLSQFYNLYLCAQESPEDGRMRTQYFLGGTDTFRLSSKRDAFDFGMNLQNISKG